VPPGKHGHAVSSAGFSSDGSRVVTASWDGSARIWDATTGKEIILLRHGDWGSYPQVYSAAFSPDGSRIVTAGADNTARIWDTATGGKIMVLRGPGLSVLCAALMLDSYPEARERGNLLRMAAFSPDGSRVVTAGSDNTARIWDTATGDEIMALHGHEGPAYSAAFSPNGSRIVTASYDKTARLWDVATGRELMVLRGHGAMVLSAAFSPDGSYVVSASSDKSARIWAVA
jgi:WD40 repeat protein